MPLAPRSDPIGGGRVSRRSTSPSAAAGAGEAEAAPKGEEEEEEEDGALPQVLPEEDAGSAARDLRAGLRYNARVPGSSRFRWVRDSPSPARISGFRAGLVSGVSDFAAGAVFPFSRRFTSS
jgi:hypothetical protein